MLFASLCYFFFEIVLLTHSKRTNRPAVSISVCYHSAVMLRLIQGGNLVSVMIDQLGNRNPTFFPTTMHSPRCVSIELLHHLECIDERAKTNAGMRRPSVKFNYGPIARRTLLLR